MPKFDLLTALSQIPRPAQHQGSLQEQMVELRQLAAHFGLYDAEDWLVQNVASPSKPSGWEEVAVYYADCQAATADTFGTTKSLSRGETARHASICTALADSLKHGALINKRPSNRERVIERLTKAADQCRKKLETK